MVRLGALLRRSPKDKSEPNPVEPPARKAVKGPPIVVMIPDVAGVSSFRIYSYPDAQGAVRFLTSLSRQQRERAHAFWALQHEPSDTLEGEDAGGEAMVLIRSAEGSDLVYIVSFLDIDSAQSFARFEVKRGMDLSLILVYWASMVNVVHKDDGVQLIPQFPPSVNKNNRRQHAPDTNKPKRHTRSEVRRLQAEADEEKKRLQAELGEMERLHAEAEELKRLQAEAAEKKRLQAEVEERGRVLQSELDEVKRLRAEAEVKRKELTAQAEENASAGEEARKWLQAEVEEKKRLLLETAEMKRLQAELEETRRLGTEAAAYRQLQLERELDARLRAEVEGQRLQAEAETQRRLAEAAEEQLRLQAELQEIEQRKTELLQRQRPEDPSIAQFSVETPEHRESDAEPIEPPPFMAKTGEYGSPDTTEQKQGPFDRQAEEQRRLAAEAEERRRLAAEAEEQRRLEAEAEEQRRLEAEAEEQRRLEAEAEEQRRLEAEAEEQRLLEAEAERRRTEAEEEERRLHAEVERRRLEAESEEQRRLEAEAEQRRLEAEAEEQGRLAAEAEQSRLEAEAAEQRRLEAEAALARVAAEAETEERRMEAEIAEQQRLEGEEEERRQFEAQKQRIFAAAQAEEDDLVGVSGLSEALNDGAYPDAQSPERPAANPIEELLRHDAASRVEIPSEFARRPRDDAAGEPEAEGSGVEHDVSKILRKRRWEKRESPFEGFKSPPGRF